MRDPLSAKFPELGLLNLEALLFQPPEGVVLAFVFLWHRYLLNAMGPGSPDRNEQELRQHLCRSLPIINSKVAPSWNFSSIVLCHTSLVSRSDVALEVEYYDLIYGRYQA